MGTIQQRKVVIAGAGGQGAETLWIFREMNKLADRPFLWDVVGFVDDNTELHGKELFGLTVLGSVKTVAPSLGAEVYYHVAIGKNIVRQSVANSLSGHGLKAATAIHPSAVIASEATVGDGVFLSALTVVGPYAEIGQHVIVNASCGIGHHVKLGDFSQICPGARINGYCQVGELGFVGSNGCLNPGVKVGIRSVLGANSLAVRDVEDGTTVLGVPARPIHRIKLKN